MPTRASAPPTSARVEIVVGAVLASAGALILVVHLDSIPGFVAELVVGFVSVAEFWPMLGGVLLLVGGVYSVARGRRGVRRHRRVVARMESMHARQEQRLQHGAGGVSAGVAGSPHRVPTVF